MSVQKLTLLSSMLLFLAAAGCAEDGGRTYLQDELPPEADAESADAEFSFDWDQSFPAVTAPVGPWNQCPEEEPSDAVYVLTAFDLADQYFNPEDLRTIESQVRFPPAGDWAAIHLQLNLECPKDNNCDNWDRFAAIDLVENAGTDDEEALELERYITPYNYPMCFLADVTAFASRLQGMKTLRSHIDTWVGPNEQTHGHGWRVTLKFIFHPGDAPGPSPREIRNIWRTGYLEIGNWDNPIDGQIAPATVTIPEWATRVELRTVSTGHGQGNARNCAEFCQLMHGITVNGERFERVAWRPDCDVNPLGPWQMGTWEYPRNGWCPGVYVPPSLFDITDVVTPGQPATLSYVVTDVLGAEYNNTCRPGQGDEENRCAGCAFTSQPGNCDYNGGNHTTPVEKVSVQLLLHD